MVARRQSCGIDVSGSRRVCRVAMYTVKSRCSGPNTYRYLTVFYTQSEPEGKRNDVLKYGTVDYRQHGIVKSLFGNFFCQIMFGGDLYLGGAK